MTTTPSAAGGGGHTPGPWLAVEYVEGGGSAFVRIDDITIAGSYRGSESDTLRTEDARLIAAAPDYFDAVEWIERAVTANAAPVNPFAALQEMTLTGAHITLDAGLVLDLLNAHAKATGRASTGASQ